MNDDREHLSPELRDVDALLRAAVRRGDPAAKAKLARRLLAPLVDNLQADASERNTLVRGARDQRR